jgi:hypothetical protein
MQSGQKIKLTREALPVCGEAAFSLFNYVTALLLFLASSTTIVNAESPDIFEQQKLTSHLLINLFLDKLDQDEIVIFENTLTRVDLKPQNVAYVHKLDDDSLLVRLCFKLQKTILVPKFEQFYVDGITVETDQTGDIIKVTTHVSPLEGKQAK